mgnify:CR=1 FL=1
MCMGEAVMSKMYNDRKDRKSREKLADNYASAPSAPPSPTADDKLKPIAKSKPKTNINTGMNIGGQY